MRCSGSKAASPFYPSSLPQLDCCPCPFIMQLFRVASWFPSFVFFTCLVTTGILFLFLFLFFLSSRQLLNSTNPKLKPMAVMMTLESIHTGFAFKVCHILVIVPCTILVMVTLPTYLDFSFFVYKDRHVYIGQCLVHNRHFNKCL